MSLPSPSIASSDATLVPSSSAFSFGQHIANNAGSESINVQIYVPEYNVQKCLQTNLDETVWEIKQKILVLLPKDMQEGFNYGLFLPPCNGRAGKFLLEDRPIRDYPFQDCVPYLELKYKKRVYKMLNLDEKALKHLHTKTNLKKFLEHVEQRQVDKVEKMCAQGLDPNFHDTTGETPLTIAASVDDNKAVVLALASGGAHLDFRNLEGQTALHKAAFLSSHSNVKTLLELSASPNYKDPLGLTPLYYCMLKTNTNANTAELLLRDYSQLGVTDPHGNQEVHQACKNGLIPHLEHLLFYGADMNCQNVNGNTPLHVCAVNDQEACARVLLFRGADPNMVNNQGQSAYHVAVITGHHGVAELIRAHDPKTAVPYRGMPRYNSKRRLGWRSSPAASLAAMSRRQSFGGSAAASECGYGTVRASMQPSYGRAKSEIGDHVSTPIGSIPPSPSAMAHPCYQFQQHYGAPSQPHPSLRQTHSVMMPAFSGTQTMLPDFRPAALQAIRKSISEQNAVTHSVGHFATVRGSLDGGATSTPIQRVAPEMLASTVSLSAEVNIPRILVIPRGPKGFGFILRGAKKVDAAVNFEPTPEIPALQYFEGVDMNGMAMKAGLKPGDFLLEINGVDVRCASHDQVVRLIQLSGDTISLKVITIDPSEPLPPLPYYGTLRRGSKAAPPPPLRHPATSLSIATGRSMAGSLTGYDEYAVGGTMPHGFHHHNRSVMYPNATTSVAKSTEHIPVAYRDPGRDDKVASVKGRVNSRRISAAELEQLMARQNSNGSSTGNSVCVFDDLESPGTPNSVRSGSTGGPRVYNSVAEMKRQKLQKMQQQQQQRGHIVLIDACSGLPSTPTANGNLKSFHSSPDLQGSVLSLARNYADERNDYNGDGGGAVRRKNGDPPDAKHYYSSTGKSSYGVPVKSVQRPKTPPPAPPATRSNLPPPHPGRPPPAPPAGYKQRGTYGPTKREQPHIPEPDYDDPPPTAAVPPAPPPPPPPAPPQTPCNDLKSALKMKRQQIMGQSSTGSESASSAASTPTPAVPTKVQTSGEQNASNGKTDFSLDLRNAIARRRTQLDQQHKTGETIGPCAPPNAGRVVGMSLKESVQNTIQPNGANGGTKPVAPAGSLGVTVTGKTGKGAGHNSPPMTNGFVHKKDSGFSSSRNSLEPAEYDENGTAATEVSTGGVHGVTSNEDTLKQHRVSVISHQLEDNLGGPHGRNRLPVQGTRLGHGQASTAKNDQQDAISLASTLSTLSGCSDATGSSVLSRQHGHQGSIPPMPREPPPVPPPDYDAADSGTGDSENDDTTPTASQHNSVLAHQLNAFRTTPLSNWSMADVCDWLDSLYLSEYKRGFSRGNVDGRRLIKCDRSQFTQLGVTRIAHRIAMENSLKQYKAEK